MRFEYVNFIFVAGPTPGDSCDDPTICESYAGCNLACRTINYNRGVCTDIVGTISCCCMY